MYESEIDFKLELDIFWDIFFDEGMKIPMFSQQKINIGFGNSELKFSHLF